MRDARRRKDLSQGALAATLGVARDTVSCLERGNRTNPRLRLLADLAAALDVSVASFVEAYLGPAATPRDPVDAGATGAPTNVHELGLLRTTGPRGMGVALRTFRVDLGAGVEGTAQRARTQRRHLERFEDGSVPSPGLLSVTRLAHAIGVHDPAVPRTGLRVRLLVQVYAGEIDAFAAIHAHRNDRRPR